MSTWYVYVLQSEEPRDGKPGLCYVGCTTDPKRRLRQHNGEISGGARYTSKHRPWVPRALFGPYPNRSIAQKAEYALKHGKRSVNRINWQPSDSKYCCGLGPKDPWITKRNK